MIVGFSLSVLLALALIVLYYSSQFLASFIEALNTFVQSVSVLIWSLLFLIIYGITSSIPQILVVCATSFPIILSVALSGISQIERKYRELSKSLGANKLQEIRYFVLPGIIPYLIASSRAAIGSALRITVVAEAFGASGGIGYMLVYSYNLGFKEGVFAWSIILVALMVILDTAVLRPIERWAKTWIS